MKKISNLYIDSLLMPFYLRGLVSILRLEIRSIIDVTNFVWIL